MSVYRYKSWTLTMIDMKHIGNGEFRRVQKRKKCLSELLHFGLGLVMILVFCAAVKF
jgi:hypothetical protein